MASNSSPIKNNVHFRYTYGFWEMRTVSEVAHVRDLAARLLAHKLAKASGLDRPDVLYQAALREAEEQLHADF